MGEWLVDADVLARARFTISPLNETVAVLLSPVARDAVRGDGFAHTLLREIRRTHWLPDMLAPPPRRGERDFDRELAKVRAVAPQLREHC